MMSHSLCCFALLVLLTGRAVVRVKASNDTIRCGYDNCCQSMAKMMTAVNEINNKEEAACSGVNEKIDKQAQDLEQMKGKLDRRLASMTKLITAVNEISKKQDELAANMNEIHGKQEKDLDELKVTLNRSLVSTSTISTQLQKHSTDLLSHDERLKAHDVSQTDLYKLVQSIQTPQLKPRDCSDISKRGSSASGVYRVDLGSDNRTIEADVYCDFKSVGQSWLVFQRRIDGRVNFDRNWNDYGNGFGDLTGEFWLGNEKLSLLTTRKKYKLRIELEDFLGEKRSAEYSTFSVKPSADKYRLTVAGYSGNAGDSFTYHNNMMFSTKDADNDLRNDLHCAQYLQGGWWFNACHYSNLNGPYLRGSHTQNWNGTLWVHWKGTDYSLKATEMKIAAVE